MRYSDDVDRIGADYLVFSNLSRRDRLSFND